MDDTKEEDQPEEQPETSSGGVGGGDGSGRRKTAIGSGGEDDSDPGGIVWIAQQEAKRLGHNFVGTEQILIALIRVRSGIAGRVLFELGLKVEDVRREVEAIVGRGSGFVAVEIPFTPRAKRVLELSWDEARQLGHSYIGTEHLLLGIVREAEGVAGRVLEKFGIKPDKVRAAVLRHLQEK